MLFILLNLVCHKATHYGALSEDWTHYPVVIISQTILFNHYPTSKTSKSFELLPSFCLVIFIHFIEHILRWCDHHSAIIFVVILIHGDIQDKIEQWLAGLFCISNLPSPCSQKFLRPLLKLLSPVSPLLRPSWRPLSTCEMGRGVPRHRLDRETLPTRRTQFTRQFDAVDRGVAVAVYHATSSSLVWEMDVSHRPVGFHIPVHPCKAGLTTSLQKYYRWRYTPYISGFYLIFFFSICKTENTSSSE